MRCFFSVLSLVLLLLSGRAWALEPPYKATEPLGMYGYIYHLTLPYTEEDQQEINDRLLQYGPYKFGSTNVRGLFPVDPHEGYDRVARLFLDELTQQDIQNIMAGQRPALLADKTDIPSTDVFRIYEMVRRQHDWEQELRQFERTLQTRLSLLTLHRDDHITERIDDTASNPAMGRDFDMQTSALSFDRITAYNVIDNTLFQEWSDSELDDTTEASYPSAVLRRPNLCDRTGPPAGATPSPWDVYHEVDPQANGEDPPWYTVPHRMTQRTEPCYQQLYEVPPSADFDPLSLDPASTVRGLYFSWMNERTQLPIYTDRCNLPEHLGEKVENGQVRLRVGEGMENSGPCSGFRKSEIDSSGECITCSMTAVHEDLQELNEHPLYAECFSMQTGGRMIVNGLNDLGCEQRMPPAELFGGYDSGLKSLLWEQRQDFWTLPTQGTENGGAPLSLIASRYQPYEQLPFTEVSCARALTFAEDELASRAVQALQECEDQRALRRASLLKKLEHESYARMQRLYAMRMEEAHRVLSHDLTGMLITLSHLRDYLECHADNKCKVN
ncbi:hypothetical protein H6771_02090 [Candidatus Peribacteria bacterium]|nr:hypothetical protein [Candidatus Peribacteria bacterium]